MGSFKPFGGPDAILMDLPQDDSLELPAGTYLAIA